MIINNMVTRGKSYEQRKAEHDARTLRFVQNLQRSGKKVSSVGNESASDFIKRVEGRSPIDYSSSGSSSSSKEQVSKQEPEPQRFEAITKDDKIIGVSDSVRRASYIAPEGYEYSEDELNRINQENINRPENFFESKAFQDSLKQAQQKQIETPKVFTPSTPSNIIIKSVFTKPKPKLPVMNEKVELIYKGVTGVTRVVKEKVKEKHEEQVKAFDDASTYLEEQRGKAYIRGVRGENVLLNQGTGFVLGVGSSLVDSGRFVYSAVTKHKETIVQVGTGVVSSVKSFVTTGSFPGALKIGSTLKEEPGFSLGYVASEVGQGYLGGKLVQTVGSKVGVKGRSLVIPVEEGTETVYKGVVVKFGDAEFPVVSKAGKKVNFFRYPEADLSNIDLGKGFIVETASETSVLRKSLPQILTPEEYSKFFGKDYGAFEILQKTKNVPSKFIQDSFVRETKTLSPKGVKVVLDVTKKNKGLLYGSFPSRTQMTQEVWEKYRGVKSPPGDIDLFLKGVSVDDAESIAKSTVKKLKKVGETARVSLDNPTLIEVQGVDGSWHHGVDIHAEPPPNYFSDSALGETGAYGFKFNQKPIKIEGISATPLSEQGVRKAASVFTLTPEGFSPKPHRLKDIPDFFATQETLIRSKNIFEQKSLLGKLETLKSKFPEEVFKVGDGVSSKTLLYSPLASNKLKSGSLIVSSVGGSFGSGSSPSIRSPGIISNIPSVSVSPTVRSPNIVSSVSISPSIKSPSIIPSPIKSPSIIPSPIKSPSIIPSVSPSPYVSLSPSPSRSRSPRVRSPSVIPSPIPSVSPSPTMKSPSIIPSVSPSPYKSPSPSPSPYPSPYPHKAFGFVPTPPIFIPKTKKDTFKGFDVFVKRRGKDVRISRNPFDELSALKFGAYSAGTTSAATFYIKPTKFLNNALSSFQKSSPTPLDSFIKKKRKSGQRVFIEPRNLRITSGTREIQEITMKGIMASKIKRIR